jgi:hypothetical protein
MRTLSSIVSWGFKLQAGRPRVQFPMRLLDFSIDLILGSTQPLTEMSTRNLLGGKARPTRKPDNLIVISEQIFQKMWEPQLPVTRITLPYLEMRPIGNPTGISSHTFSVMYWPHTGERLFCRAVSAEYLELWAPIRHFTWKEDILKICLHHYVCTS